MRKCECAEGARSHTGKSTWGDQTQIEPTQRGAVPFGVRSIVSFRLFSAVSLRVSQLATKGINLKQAAWVTPLQPSLQPVRALNQQCASLDSDTVAAHPSPKNTKEFIL